MRTAAKLFPIGSFTFFVIAILVLVMGGCSKSHAGWGPSVPDTNSYEVSCYLEGLVSLESTTSGPPKSEGVLISWTDRDTEKTIKTNMQCVFTEI